MPNPRVLSHIIIVSETGEEFKIPSSCMSPYLREAVTDILVEEQLVREANCRDTIDAELFLSNAKETKESESLPLSAYEIKVNKLEVLESPNKKIVIKYKPELYAMTPIGRVKMGTSARYIEVRTGINVVRRGIEILDFTVSIKQTTALEVYFEYTIKYSIAGEDVLEYKSESSQDVALTCFRLPGVIVDLNEDWRKEY